MRAVMIEQHLDIFKRCCAKPLPPPGAYAQTPEGTQRYKTEYALRRFEIDDSTRAAVKCPCCHYVGLRNGVFSSATSERFPPPYRQQKFVFRRVCTGTPPVGRRNYYYIYLRKSQARPQDELLSDVCSKCIDPMRGGELLQLLSYLIK